MLTMFLTISVASAQTTDSTATESGNRKIEKEKTYTGKDRKLADTSATIRRSSTADTIKNKKRFKKTIAPGTEKNNTINPNGTVNPTGTKTVPKSTNNSPKGSNPNGTKVPSGTSTVPK